MLNRSQPVAAPIKLSDLLRSQTRAAHEAVEAALSSSLQNLTLDGYAKLVASWREVHRYVEPAILEQMPLELAPFVRSRLRLDLLEQDLTSLDRGAIAATSFDQTPLPIDSPAEALGSLYVLEGSTLGGQILCKRFAEQLALTTDHGLRYFNSYGSQTAARWRETKQLLDDPRWHDQHVAIIAAANRTFEALTQYFSTM